MALVRTNITIPGETLALVDAVAGPRGRSAYIADVVARQVRRDNARMVFEKYAGFLKESDTWGRTPQQTDRLLREVRESWDRPWIWEDAGAVPARHDAADRSRQGPARRGRSRAQAVRRAE